MSRPGLLDAHAHFWDPGRFRYDWFEGDPELDRRHLPSDLSATASDLPALIFVEAGSRPQDGLDEARWVDALAASWPQIAGIVASAPVEEGSGVTASLGRLAELPRVVGVRRVLQGEREDFFRLGSLHDGLAAVGAAGFTFDACVRHSQLGALVELLRPHPGLPVVLDHLGKPPLADGLASEPGRAWVRNIRLLAELPNTYVKLSGLPAEVPDATFPSADFLPWLAEALDAFGPSRAMVGSDWPVSAHGPTAVGYDEWFHLVLDSLGLSDAQLQDLTWRTAGAFYGILPPLGDLDRA